MAVFKDGDLKLLCLFLGGEKSEKMYDRSEGPLQTVSHWG